MHTMHIIITFIIITLRLDSYITGIARKFIFTFELTPQCLLSFDKKNLVVVQDIRLV